MSINYNLQSHFKQFAGKATKIGYSNVRFGLDANSYDNVRLGDTNRIILETGGDTVLTDTENG